MAVKNRVVKKSVSVSVEKSALEKASELAPHNGQFAGLDVPVSSAKIIIQPVPWDVTTSYRAGTVNGPAAVIEASYQLDLYSPEVNTLWEIPLATEKIPADILKKSKALRKLSAAYIQALEVGQNTNAKVWQNSLRQINTESEKLNDWVFAKTKTALDQEAAQIILGGDHSVPFGAIKAYVEKFPQMSILHFDAHADLRPSYEGFQHSHASIMNNVLAQTKLKKLVQVGIRDVGPIEIAMIDRDSRVKTFFDWEMKAEQSGGASFQKQIAKIVTELSQQVYISFDIDGLDPKLCPNTGTPVPGGLEFNQAIELIWAVVKSGRKVIGADLVEVAPGADKDSEWDANVGARVLMNLAAAIWKSQNL
jgi:agmatinase